LQNLLQELRDPQLLDGSNVQRLQALVTDIANCVESGTDHCEVDDSSESSVSKGSRSWTAAADRVSRKNAREQQRRLEVNSGFSKLADCLSMDMEGKKLYILVAVRSFVSISMLFACLTSRLLIVGGQSDDQSTRIDSRPRSFGFDSSSFASNSQWLCKHSSCERDWILS